MLVCAVAPRLRTLGATGHSQAFSNNVMANFPKFMYHATKAPVQVSSVEQQLELGPEWSETYIPQPYPKWKFHLTKPDQCVANADEEAKLGGGWAGTPAAFAPY